MAVLAIICAVGLLVILQGGLYRKYWNRRLSLSIAFSESTATEGDRLALTEVITNRKILPLPWLAVKFQVSRELRFTDRDNSKISDDYYRNDLFNVQMFQRITRRLPFVCGKRGYYTVKSAELISGDILAREKFAMPANFRAALTVYPRALKDLDSILVAHRQFLGRLLTKRYIQPDPFEFKGIREYQPYDSLRSVNFKATAKTGDLMVNIPDYTVTQEIIIVLNTQPYSAYPSDSLYEDSIRLAAALAAYYLDNAVPVSFITNARTADSRDGGLTRVAGGSGAGHLTNIFDVMARMDLTKPVIEPGRAMLDELASARGGGIGVEPAYVVISTFHEKEFINAFDALTETGAEALWLIPALPGMDVTAPLSEHCVKVEMKG